MDCLVVPEDAKLRSLRVVHRRWTANTPDGCADFVKLSHIEHVARHASELGHHEAVAEIAELMRRREAP
jgi:hypothetical protein